MQVSAGSSKFGSHDRGDDELFAVAFGRSCPAPLNASSPGCHVLAVDDVPANATIGGDGGQGFVGRCYANPITSVGPAPDEMLMPTMLVFDPAETRAG